MWNPSKCLQNADVTFSSQTNRTAESYSQIRDVNGNRAGGESTENANRLVATDWITPLFMQNSPERPTVGICQGRRSCRSFIRPTMELSLLHHIIWLPGLCCQDNDSQSTMASFQPEARLLAAGRVVLVFEELGQGRDNLEKMLWVTQQT